MPASMSMNARWPRPHFDDMAELFDQFTAVWDGIDRGAFSEWLRKQLATGKRAVDLGCGAGRHIPLLAERYGQVLGVDVSARMLELARKHHSYPNVTYRQAEVLDVDPAAGDVFDAVVSVATLHHAGDPETVLRHVRSVVAPNGRAVIVDMVNLGGWDKREWHVARAFGDARVAYQLTGEVEKTLLVLRQLLDPSWLNMATTDIPLPRERFRQLYAQVFPGAAFHDELHPLMTGMSWTAPS